MNTLAASTTSMGEAVQFWVLGTIAVAGALGTILMRRAVHSALCLAGTMIVLAVFYLANGAYFLGVVQIIVYTGAIMMLFLFVVMLVGVDASDSLVETIRGQRLLTAVVALLFGLTLVIGVAQVSVGAISGLDTANTDGNVVGLAELLFTKYIFAFEVTSALLITAALGAMVLAHKERTEPRVTQRELSRRRFTSDHPWPLPGPGVFAGTNSTATPALLPDGSEAPDSVSPVLERRSAERPDAPSAAPVGKDLSSTPGRRSEVEG
jgi:NADH-quinone oxidoreductase subunit J